MLASLSSLVRHGILQSSFVLGLIAFAMMISAVAKAQTGNPKITQGTSATISGVVQLTANSPAPTWTITNSSSQTVAVSTSPNGWNVVRISAGVYTVTVPFSAPVATNYQAKYIVNAPVSEEIGTAIFDVVSRTGIPPAPTNLVATAGNASIGLTWNASAGASTYNIKRSLTSGGPYGTVKSVSGTSTSDYPLNNGTTYYYVVTASNTSGESPNSNQASATPVAVIPPAPTNLTATPANQQITLSWQPSVGATSYKLKKSLITGGPYTLVTTIPTGTSYADTGLTNGTTYYYVVTALNSAGESANSNEASATPTIGTIPSPPTNLAATAGNAQVALTWTASTGATTYNLKRSLTTGGPYTTTVATGITGLSALDSSPSNGTTYYYVVTAVNAAGESGISNEASATPQAPIPPNPPTGLRALPGNTKVNLFWNGSVGATSYNIKCSTTDGGPYTLVTNQPGTSYLHTALTNGVTYYYIVTAVGAAESSPSVQAKATPTGDRVPLGILPNPALGFLPDALTVVPWMESTIPTSSSSAPSAGPSGLFSINLPYGVVDASGEADIVMDNPFGGAVVFQRFYRTALASGNLSSPGLPAGWTHNWDIKMIPLTPNAWGTIQLVYPNGASEPLIPNVTVVQPLPTAVPGLIPPPPPPQPGSFQVPVGAPYTVTGVQDPNNVGKWTSITIWHNGQAKEVFTMDAGDSVYRLHTVVNGFGSTLNLTYNNTRLARIKTASATGVTDLATMYLAYDGSGMLTQVDFNSNFYNNSTSDTRVNFNYSAGLLTSATSRMDPAVNFRSYTYQDVGAVQPYMSTAYTYGSQGHATLTYDSQTGRASRLTDANGNYTTYTYNPSAGTTTVDTYSPTAKEDSSRVTYDILGRQTAEKDAAANTSTVQYGTADPSSVTAALPPSGAGVTIQRDSHFNPTLYTYPYGNKVAVTWEYPTIAQFGRVKQVQELGKNGEAKAPTTYQYYAVTDAPTGAIAGFLQSVTSPRGGVTTITYTAMGNVATVTSPTADGSTGVTQFSYTTYTNGVAVPEVLGKPNSITDPLGRVTKYSYNAYYTTVTDPMGHETTVSFDRYFQTTDLAQGTGRAIHFGGYPGKPANAATLSGDGFPTTNLYSLGLDFECAPTSYNDPVGQSSTSIFDSLYNLKSLKNGNNVAMHTFTDNPFANTSASTHGQYSGQQQWSENHDANGLVTTFTGPNYSGSYGPRLPGGLPSVVNFQGTQSNNNTSSGTTSVGYDGFGRVTNEQIVLNGVGTGHTYTYDDEDNLLTDTNGATGVTFSNFVYTYTTTGQRKTMTVDGYTYNYTYDKGGRVTAISVSNGGSSVAGVGATYTYDALDRVTSARTAQATILYTYDSYGQLTKLQNLTRDGYVPDPGSIAIDPINGSSHSTLSVFDTMSYNIYGNRTGMRFLVQGLLFGATQRPYTSGSATFNIDAQLRYETWTVDNYPGLYVERHYYLDSAENMTGIRGLTFGYDNATDMVNSASSPYSDIQYDVTGSLTRFRGIAVNYNLMGQPTTMDKGLGPVTMSYDAEGHRLWKGTTNFAYDGSMLVTQGSTYFLWGPTGPIQQFGSAVSPSLDSVATFTYDPNGNTISRIKSVLSGETNIQLSLVDHPHLYDGYGETLWHIDATEAGEGADSGNNFPFRYKGQVGYVTDFDTDLIYCWNRYYDPRSGRWISPDPAGLEGGINEYEYCSGNPTEFADPDGLEDGPSGDKGLEIFNKVMAWENSLSSGALSGVTFGHSDDFFNYVGLPSLAKQNFAHEAGSGLSYLFGFGEIEGVAKVTAKVGAGVSKIGGAAKAIVIKGGDRVADKIIAGRLQKITTAASKTYKLTTRQAKRIAITPGLEAAFRGERIDRLAKQMASNDRVLKFLRVNSTPAFKFGPDFFRIGKESWWDITTATEWAAHVKKYGAGGTRLGY